LGIKINPKIEKENETQIPMILLIQAELHPITCPVFFDASIVLTTSCAVLFGRIIE
jgi:hypothetical protein